VGDLFVPDFGVAGPLVAEAFLAMQSIEPGCKALSAEAATKLADELRELTSDTVATSRGPMKIFRVPRREK
jgi:hypothetical protein